MAVAPFTLVPSGAITANGNSAVMAFGGLFGAVSFEVAVTAVSGSTPNLALAIQWSNDGVNFGAPDGGGDTFTAITSVTNVVKAVPIRALYARIAWTVTGGSPSFTLSVTGTA